MLHSDDLDDVCVRRQGLVNEVAVRGHLNGCTIEDTKAEAVGDGTGTSGFISGVVRLCGKLGCSGLPCYCGELRASFVCRLSSSNRASLAQPRRSNSGANGVSAVCILTPCRHPLLEQLSSRPALHAPPRSAIAPTISTAVRLPPKRYDTRAIFVTGDC